MRCHAAQWTDSFYILAAKRRLVAVCFSLKYATCGRMTAILARKIRSVEAHVELKRSWRIMIDGRMTAVLARKICIEAHVELKRKLEKKD